MDWLKILAIAFAATGWIQWAKKFAPTDWPTWVWGVALVPISLGMAAVMYLAPPFVQAAVVALALAQLGYETIVQGIKKLAGLA